MLGERDRTVMSVAELIAFLHKPKSDKVFAQTNPVVCGTELYSTHAMSVYGIKWIERGGWHIHNPDVFASFFCEHPDLTEQDRAAMLTLQVLHRLGE